MQPKRRTARMTDIVEVLKVMQNSPTAAYLRECSFHERVMLTAFVKCIKRAGVDTVKWGDVSTTLCCIRTEFTSTHPDTIPTFDLHGYTTVWG